MKKFLEFVLIVLVPWTVIFWMVFHYNSDSDSDFYPESKISIQHDPAPAADHSKFAALQKDFKSGPEVTEACLSCHNATGKEVMKTEHWKWHKQDSIPGRGVMDLGKTNVLNNFCIGVNSNEPLCSKCHAGYGYANKEFDFDNQNNIDCLVCHDATNTYSKAAPSKANNFTGAGYPDSKVDLRHVAQHVGFAKRENCGHCHFTGGGGNNVKHGDLEIALLSEHTGLNAKIDVHMGRGHGEQNMQCTDCHTTEHHQISGQLYSVASSNNNHVTCVQCHTEAPHKSKLLNQHYRTIACQTCHIVEYAKVQPTKIIWDWSTATTMDAEGKPMGVTRLADSVYTHDGVLYENVIVQFDSKHGTAVLGQNLQPEYIWFNGTADHHLLTDKIQDTAVPLMLNPLFGSYQDNVSPQDTAYPSRIWPVKVMRGRQPYDPVNLTLIQPKLFGESKGSNALWVDYDWDAACRAGMEYTGLPYSGQYAFVNTESYWPLNHEVSKAAQALQCADCHNSHNSRLMHLSGFYLPGRDNNFWVDMPGVLFIVLIMLGVIIHGGLRMVSHKKSN